MMSTQTNQEAAPATSHFCSNCSCEVDAQGACGTEGCDTETVSVVEAAPQPYKICTKWARVTQAAFAVAIGLTKGDYQRNFLCGTESLSGSTLKGTAAKYGARYKDSRNSLIARMRSAGLEVSEIVEERRRVLVVSKPQ